MQKIGIIGLGLIGGSILKALSLSDWELYAVSHSSAHKAKSYTPFASNMLEDLSPCDIIFVCSPMSKTKQILKRLENIVQSNCIVCDVCSLKGFLEDEYKFNYIGTHPMAGTEFSGFDASYDTLFKGAKWVITKRNKVLEQIIEFLGARSVVMSPYEHDKAAAQISHLPMLLSFALFNSVTSDEAKLLASSGFRDTTRLAMTNSTLASDMLNLNKENIQQSLDNFIQSLEYLKKLSDDERIKVLENLAQQRTGLYDKNGKNQFYYQQD